GRDLGLRAAAVEPLCPQDEPQRTTGGRHPRILVDAAGTEDALQHRRLSARVMDAEALADADRRRALRLSQHLRQSSERAIGRGGEPARGRALQAALWQRLQGAFSAAFVCSALSDRRYRGQSQLDSPVRTYNRRRALLSSV